MKQIELRIFTSYASPSRVNSIIKENFIPVFIIENLSKIGYLEKWNGSPVHLSTLAPSGKLLWKYKNGEIDFEEYEKRYIIGLSEVNLKKTVSRLQSMANLFNAHGIVLLGLEEDPNRCHRKSLAELLNLSGLLKYNVEEL